MIGLRFALSLLALLFSPGIAWALDPGDIVFTDERDGLFYAERVTGNEHHVGTLGAPGSQGLGAVATDAAGNIYGLLAFAGVVFRIDAVTGAYLTVASGFPLQYPHSISVLSDGDVLVSDRSGGVIRVDPASGAKTGLYPGAAYASTVSAAGTVHVMLPDPNRVIEPACRVYRIDSTSGDTTRISNTHVSCGGQMATETNDNLVMTQPTTHSVIRMYPSAAGAVATLSSGGELVEPYGIAVEGDGTIVVTSVHGLPGCNPAGAPESCEGLLLRIDPVTGAQAVMTSSGYWRHRGIDLYRGPHADTPVRRVTWGQVKIRYR